MPRDCSHMPGAAKETNCKLCETLAKKQPIVGEALKVLNQQPPKEQMRTCAICHGQVKHLVTRGKELMCQECAEAKDAEE